MKNFNKVHYLVIIIVLFTGCGKEEIDELDIEALVSLNVGSVLTLPADGVTSTVIRVQLDAHTDTSIKEVEFTTTLGSFPGGATYKATIQSDRSCSAVLTTGRVPGPCSISARVATLTVQKDLQFVTARPTNLDLALSHYAMDTAANTPVDITVFATRVLGRPTEGQLVWYSFSPDTSSTGLILPATGVIDADGHSTVVVSNPFKRVGAFLLSARMVGEHGDTLQASRTLVIE